MAVESPTRTIKYAELFCGWLEELGYTHCYFVAGGNIMHLIDGVRKRFTCIPVVHEVAAGIAAEYHNETSGGGRAFALVTAGPGLTNIVTGVANAWLESRELLVIGGQAKSTDLADGGIRQRGIQEIDGRSIVAPIAVRSLRMERPWSKRDVFDAVLAGRRGRPGPVFLELCLDAQGAPVSAADLEAEPADAAYGPGAAADDAARAAVPEVVAALRRANRPLLLLGGGITRDTAAAVRADLERTGIPVATTWNAADRIPADFPAYAGRPNTWGQRFANVIAHQADCIVVLGSRLGMQQTGFNWQAWGAHAHVIQFDLDRAELEKGHPRVDRAVCGDANVVLRALVREDYPDFAAWRGYVRDVREILPTNEAVNTTGAGFISPYRFYQRLSALCGPDDILIPSSSGGANFVAMQCIEQRAGQLIVTDKGLASMGIALGGAIGAALAHRDRRTVLVDGDGGFLQNAQELATVAVNALNLKIFIFANNGYGSIRTTQKNYFGGAYLGCDIPSGLGFPDWPKLFDAFGLGVSVLDERGLDAPEAQAAFERPGPHGFIVPIDPEQSYFPKVTSRITATGSMESQPLHLMAPDLSDDVAARVFRFVPPSDAR
uniref:Acetolactate synthase isozyme 1 large subunit n=1 Tax=uncultured organism TaxID=155900 RepID=A0A7L9QC02_9ZZZZ|nr:acetolactate synthase isozyme 1 large subunit [uncultured organism]